MRILISSFPLIALTAILATSARQKIEVSILTERDAGVLPETTQVLLESRVASQKRSGERQRAERLRAAVPIQSHF